ncbi:hypothetical protein FH972_006568 [Carpinus fangiana]|uniref:Uncharacterized protein n=1 Tax=Carpinus fangiana TaxID=176857 RepID=A0A5N6QUJ5_9ROSI|nr:hypothetical protein FH972_006568 [Carpinus fangiana]
MNSSSHCNTTVVVPKLSFIRSSLLLNPDTKPNYLYKKGTTTGYSCKKKQKNKRVSKIDKVGVLMGFGLRREQVQKWVERVRVCPPMMEVGRRRKRAMHGHGEEEPSTFKRIQEDAIVIAQADRITYIRVLGEQVGSHGGLVLRGLRAHSLFYRNSWNNYSSIASMDSRHRNFE